jgi:general secretion pathway protein H
MLGMVVAGSGQVAGARLRKTATNITGAVRVAYTRSTATSKNLRIVFDIDNSAMWLEEGDLPMLVQTSDTTGTGGADAVTEAERAAVAETDGILKGQRAARPSFHAVDSFGISSGDPGPAPSVDPNAPPPPAPDDADGGAPPNKGPRKLERGIKIRQIQTGHDDASRTSGRAYLYFWPGGLTERASIQLRIGESKEDGDTITLIVSPLTGRITVKNGPQSLVVPHDDKEASEREDKGS